MPRRGGEQRTPRIASATALLTAMLILVGGCAGTVPGVTIARATAVESPAPPAGRIVSTPMPDSYFLRPVDRVHALPATYVPPDLVVIPVRWTVPGYGTQQLRRMAADALIRMLSAAQTQSLAIRVRSSYRSYATQVATFQYWVRLHGVAEARRESAEAGHSEHQLGTAVDLTSASVGWGLDASFGNTAEGRWLADHALRYGFALSYPRGAEQATGYEYEPWHFRYIGADAAAGWRASGLPLTTYLQSLGQEAR